MFDVFYLGKKPGLFVHERAAESIEHAQQLSRTRHCWVITYLADYSGWDFLWEPVPWQRDFVHVWPSQWHDFSGTYLIPKHTAKIAYHFHDRVILNRARPEEFVTHEPAIEFDWTWSPHPLDPPYHYVFGNQWWPGNKWATVEYLVPGASELKYMDSVRGLLPGRPWECWRQLHDCDWDFSWRPDPGDPPYIYVFGNQWWPAEKMATVEYHAPGAQHRKFINHPKARLRPCADHWAVPEELDSSEIDLSWLPDPGAPPYVYQFGTQHQKTGGPVYRVPGATEIKYVDQIKVTVRASRAAVYIIDHMDGNISALQEQLKDRAAVEKVSRYVDNYLDTLRRIATGVPYEIKYIWIVSSVCDYTDFDFTWYPEQWQATMLHVFASGSEKFGDTFFMHVPTFRAHSDSCQLLDWYDVNYVPDRSVPRRPMPVIYHQSDSQVEVVRTRDWQGPLALFTNHDYVPENLVTVSLWREKTKTIVPLSAGATAVIVPKTAIPYIKTQLYDYPYIDRSQKTLEDAPLDIVFIANGEHGAEHHWDVLQGVLKNQDAANRLHRVDGVNGRVAAYQAAASKSATPWFFAVFAKLQVNVDFDWRWQPDRMQQCKHYIFHAYNPVNHLVYGHQAVIAYNQAMTLVNSGTGLDFTLDQPHEVVPVVSGTAYYDNDPWTCWRTAFRECIKLRYGLPDVENEYRLAEWLARGDGVNGSWSTQGARDAVYFYDWVDGDFLQLKQSYEWAWLASYAIMLHPALFTHAST